MAVWQRYRASCRPHPTGCRQCGEAIRESRAYCHWTCQEEFDRNHFWGTARNYAIAVARPFGPAPEFQRQPWFGSPLCVRCGNPTDAPEVNHIVPLNGNRPHFGCEHHQANLEVVCHGCHVQIGIEQRRAGLIGKPKPQRWLELTG